MTDKNDLPFVAAVRPAWVAPGPPKSSCYKAAPRRLTSGAAVLTLVVQIIFLIAGLGLFLLTVCIYIGGQRELENSTDAASLSIAKQMLKQPALTINPGTEEFNNFDGLTEGTHQINLLNFNRVMGQTLLVELNARAEETPAALGNAIKLVASYRKAGRAFHNVFFQSHWWQENLQQSASLNSSGMLRTLEHMSESRAKVVDKPTDAPLNRVHAVAEAALQQQLNTSHSRQALPPEPTNSLVSLSLARMKKRGPTNVYIDESLLLPEPSTFATVRKNNKVYLCGYAPQGIFASLSIEGVPLQPGDRPHLVSSSEFVQSLPSTLVTTPFGPTNASSVTSTAKTSTTHPLPDNGTRNSDVNLVPANAVLLRNTQVMKSGFPMHAASAAIVGSLQKDYRLAIPGGYIVVQNGPPSSQELSTANTSGSLMAVEAFNCAVLQAWIEAWLNFDQWANGGRFSQHVPPPPMTGLRILNRGRPEINYPEQNQNFSLHPQISHSGSFMELVNYVAAGMGSSAKSGKLELLNALRQRIKEIGSFSDQQIETVLSSAIPLELGETAYIYSSGGELLMSKQPPPSLVPNTAADGPAKRMLAATYADRDLLMEVPIQITRHAFIDGARDNGPDARIAIDQVVWTPSTGYNNLLGTVSFNNAIIGKGGETVFIKI